MGSRTARIFHEHVLVKEPGTREVSPWHQDQPYYCVDGEQVLSIWLPLDPVPRSVSPEFVAGSHLWGKLFTPRKFVDHRPYEGSLSAFETVPGHRRPPGGVRDPLLGPRAGRLHRLSHEDAPWRAGHRGAPVSPPGVLDALARRRCGFRDAALSDLAAVSGADSEAGRPMEHELFPVVLATLPRCDEVDLDDGSRGEGRDSDRRAGGGIEPSGK